MATLAEINTTLQEQNTYLEKTSESISDFVDNIKGEKGDKLEADREKRTRTSILSAAGGAIRTGGERAARGLRDFKLPELPSLGTLLNPIALGALATAFISKFANKLLKGGLLAIFAEDLANFVLGPEASKELKDQLARAFTFAGFGSLFGLRVGFLAGLIGFFVDDPEGLFRKISEIMRSDGLQKFRKAIRMFFVEGLQSILTFADTLKNEGITAAVFQVFKDKNAIEFFGTLAAVGTGLSALLFGRKGLMLLPGLGWWATTAAIDFFRGLADIGSKLGNKLRTNQTRNLTTAMDQVDPTKPRASNDNTAPQRRRPSRFSNLFRVVRSGANAGAIVATSAATAALPFLAAGATIVAGGYLAGLAANTAEDFFTKDLTPAQKEERDRTASIYSISGLPPGFSDASPLVQRELANRLQELEDFKSGKKQSSLFNLYRTQEDVEYDIARLLNNIRISRLSTRQQALQEAITVQNEGRLSGGGQMMAMVGSNNDQSVNTLIQENMSMMSTIRSTDPLVTGTNQ